MEIIKLGRVYKTTTTGVVEASSTTERAGTSTAGLVMGEEGNVVISNPGGGIIMSGPIITLSEPAENVQTVTAPPTTVTALSTPTVPPFSESTSSSSSLPPTGKSPK